MSVSATDVGLRFSSIVARAAARASSNARVASATRSSAACPCRAPRRFLEDGPPGELPSPLQIVDPVAVALRRHVLDHDGPYHEGPNECYSRIDYAHERGPSARRVHRVVPRAPVRESAS